MASEEMLEKEYTEKLEAIHDKLRVLTMKKPSQRQLQLLEEITKDQCSEIKSLHEQLKDLSLVKHQSIQVMGRLELDNYNLKNQLEKEKEEKEILELELEEARGTVLTEQPLSNLLVSADEAENELESGKLQKLEEDLKFAKDEMFDAVKKFKNLEKDHEKLSEAMKNLKENTKFLLSKAPMEDIADLKNELQEAREALQNEEENYKKLQEKLAWIQKNSMTAAAEKTGENPATIAELQKQREQCYDDIYELSAKYREAKAKAYQAEEKLKEEIQRRIVAEMKMAQEYGKCVPTEIEKLQKALSDSEDLVKRYERLNSGKNKRISDLMEKTAKLERSLTETEEKLFMETSFRCGAERASEEKHQINNYNMETIMVLEETLESKEQIFADEVADLKKQLAEAQEALKKKEKPLNRFRSILTPAEKTAMQKVEELEKEREIHNDELRDLGNKLGLYMGKYEKLEEAHKALESENLRLKQVESEQAQHIEKQGEKILQLQESKSKLIEWFDREEREGARGILTDDCCDCDDYVSEERKEMRARHQALLMKHYKEQESKELQKALPLQSSSNDEVADLKKKLAKAQKALKEMKAENCDEDGYNKLDTYKGKIERLEKAQKASKKYETEQARLIEQQGHRIIQLRDSKNELTDELQEATKTIAELKKGAASEVQLLKNVLAEQRDQRDQDKEDWHSILDGINEENSKLEEQLKKKDQEICKLKKQLMEPATPIQCIESEKDAVIQKLRADLKQSIRALNETLLRAAAQKYPEHLKVVKKRAPKPTPESSGLQAVELKAFQTLMAQEKKKGVDQIQLNSLQLDNLGLVLENLNMKSQSAGPEKPHTSAAGPEMPEKPEIPTRESSEAGSENGWWNKECLTTSPEDSDDFLELDREESSGDDEEHK